ncbi:hypothetical protein ALP32_200314 [Pseudomonas avellanae]|uniref:Uncharacterized protein n=1 Tax=Pseudomonas avellanae TaxID=46257 RepID=A0A3M5SUH8_9PSED|nr:hypothetical protein ALP32_200314 [Pseudomonas avellanae]
MGNLFRKQYTRLNLPSDGRLTVLQATFNVLPSLSFELIGMTRELLLCFAHLLETPLLHKAIVDCSSFWRIVNWLNRAACGCKSPVLAIA